jgi:hypothetical protein
MFTALLLFYFFNDLHFTQDFKPRIHLSESDYAVFTQSGTLCDEHGNLGPQQFETALRRQMKIYTQRQLSNALILGASSRAELLQLGTLKALLREQAKFQEEQARIDERNLCVSGCVETVRCDVAALRQELRELSGQLCCCLGKQEFRPVFSSQVFEVMPQAKTRPVRGTDEPCIASMTPRSFAEDGTSIMQSPRQTLSKDISGKKNAILSAGVWPNYPGNQDSLLTSCESGNALPLVLQNSGHAQDNAQYTSMDQLVGLEYSGPQGGMPGCHGSEKDSLMPDPSRCGSTGRPMNETKTSVAELPSRVPECSVVAEHGQGTRLDALTPSSSSSSAEDYLSNRSGCSGHNFCQPENGFADRLPHYCEKELAVGDDLGVQLQFQPVQEESALYSSEINTIEDKSSKPTEDAGAHTNKRIGFKSKHSVECQPSQDESALYSPDIKAVADKGLEHSNDLRARTNQHVGSNGYIHGLEPNKRINFSVDKTPNLEPSGTSSIIRSSAEIKWSKRGSGHVLATQYEQSSAPSKYLGSAAKDTSADMSTISKNFDLEESLHSRFEVPTLGMKEGSVFHYYSLFVAMLSLVFSKKFLG